MALRAVPRVGSLLRVVPQLSTASTRGFANFDERERGEERVHFKREEERLLRDLLAKVKKQTDETDKAGADKSKSEELSKLKSMVGKYNMKEADLEELIKWKHAAA
ncbi:hypothetical protein WJX77_005569 [Trebouxia sp. C0004]